MPKNLFCVVHVDFRHRRGPLFDPSLHCDYFCSGEVARQFITLCPPGAELWLCQWDKRGNLKRHKKVLDTS